MQCPLALRVDLAWDGGEKRGGDRLLLCLRFGLLFGCTSGRVSWDRSLRAVLVRASASSLAMETLVISEQRSHHQLHRSSGRRKKGSSASPHFSSPQSTRGYYAGNCRAFHSGITIGILPAPPAQGFARTRSSPEPKTPKQQQLGHGKRRSRAISISPSTSPPSRPELWAGPGFCNSPPPSSLPIPKFSLHQNSSVSLEFPPADRSDDEEVPVHPKSAPSSPTAGSGVTLFSGADATIATENLRRILHLKIEHN